MPNKSLKSIIENEKSDKKRVLRPDVKEFQKPNLKRPKTDVASTMFDNVGQATEEERRKRFERFGGPDKTENQFGYGGDN